jgi:hypothetical protein
VSLLPKIIGVDKNNVFHFKSNLALFESIPGLSTVSNDNGKGGSDAVWMPWIKNTFVSVAHPIGTAAMMRRDLGGECLAGTHLVERTKTG